MAQVRIQKYLAEAGAASRRGAEEMILEGRVTVNGQLVLELPCFVDGETDEVRLDGRAVRPRRAGKTYLLLNKPRGVACGASDARGRPTVTDVIGPSARSLRCAAPLEPDSSGIVLLTDDGQVQQVLTHARYAFEKTYVAEVDGAVTDEAMQGLQRGVWLDGRRTRGAQVKVVRGGRARTTLEIRLAESHNRQLRRVLAKLGCKVRRLRRTALGPLAGRGLHVGRSRPLRPGEVRQLKRAVLAAGGGE